MFLYTRMKQDGNISKKSQQDSSTSTQQAVLYRTCAELPFDRFISCVTTHQYAALIKTPGTVKYGELVQVWNDIRIEFIDLNSDNDSLYLVKLEKQINTIYSHLYLVRSLLFVLSTSYHPSLVDQLKQLGYDYPFDPKNMPQYNHSFNCIENRLAGQDFKLQQKQQEYQQFIANKKEGTYDEKHFRRILVKLAKHRHILVIRPADIMTDEFVYMWQDYLHDIKSNES